jgi:hypothetical protein
MSGGSLDYLYCKEPEELFNHCYKYNRQRNNMEVVRI